MDASDATVASATSSLPCPSCGLRLERETSPATSSRIEHLLKTNDMPGEPTERASIAGIVADRRARLVDVEDHIALAQKILDGLLRYREQTQRDIDDHLAILSPARRLPNDILTEIFLSCIEEDVESSELPSSLDSREMPWCLAQVSSRWRTVALSFPRLWSTIRIKIASAADANDIKASHRRETHLATQLHRSASHHLLVSLQLPRGENSTIPHSLLRTLVSTSPRWKQLFLEIPLIAVGAISSMKGFLQTLTTLRIHIFAPRSTEQVQNSPLHDLFQYAPSLRTVVSKPYQLLSLSLPHQQIWEYKTGVAKKRPAHGFEIFTSAASQHLKLLNSLPNLERGSLMCCSALENPPAAGFTHVLCNHLRTLILWDSPGQVLAHLTLPALTSLTIYCNKTSIHSFLSRSPWLQRLRLLVTKITDEDCLDLLACTPSLQKLVFSDEHILTLKFIEELASRTALAPALTAIVSEVPLRSTRDFEDALGVLGVVRPHLRITSSEVELWEL